MTDTIRYQEGVLTWEGVPLPDIAAQVGTPVYVYSKAELLRRARAFSRAAGQEALVCYAIKANGNPAILHLLQEAGLGADVTSGGELFLALKAGIAPQKIIFSGVGKRDDEIEMALKNSIRALHVESEMEFERIAHIATGLRQVAPVAVRVNPDIGAETHPYDSTGRLVHKFGVPRDTAVSLYREAARHPWLQPLGLAAHIGSQITDIRPYLDLLAFLLELASELAAAGVSLSYIDAGGGLGIAYEKEDVLDIAEWAAAICEPIRRAGYRPVLEPGRAIAGPAGLLLTRVLYTKVQGGKSFTIVDAGMNDLVRPAMYEAVHPLLPVKQAPQEAALFAQDVVGPVCETGDFIAHSRPLPEMASGDLLAVTQAGAYGFAMSSNYNGRLRLAEVLIENSDYQLIRSRQRYEDLLAGC